MLKTNFLDIKSFDNLRIVSNIRASCFEFKKIWPQKRNHT